MRTSGYVLAGGASRRMGRDKARLEVDGTTLIERIARRVLEAAGSVAIVGAPASYGSLGFPVIPDLIDGAGPLAGIHAALTNSDTAWNLVVACDLPGVNTADLLLLRERTGAGTREAVAAFDAAGQSQPLCAFYHRSVLPRLDAALRSGQLCARDFLASLNAERVDFACAATLSNINTPEDWSRYQRFAQTSELVPELPQTAERWRVD